MTSHGYSVELYFDPALENQVLKAWNVLARRQISTHLIQMESRPHITLFSTSSIDPPKLLSPIKSFASRLEPIPLSLSSVAASSSLSSSSLSLESNLLFLCPTPTFSLLDLHSRLIDSLKKEGIEIPEPFRPDSWIPHCLVAQDVPQERMGETFTVLRDVLKLPVSGYGLHVGLVEFPPVRELFSFPVGNPSDF
ncbi:hypothetical protein AMTRI_Chr10g5990 [Amborella trichopoda]|uniref:uncharacterized protein LOC18427593 n=1 Tax=Amborella trichopoda TaxID=13333 RepID=UPI0005D389EE|nr:uncharacterized protein LOC18427593 [Amborella trichopoda]|eukprot:XP_011620904.1 uncharacterized protein LOC18427593 [Amborella trichopoda]